MSGVIIFNGPPGSGKDTAVKFASEVVDAEHVKVSAPIYNAIGRLFEINHDRWRDLYLNHKDEPSMLLCGMTPRQAMTWMSEEAVKPQFGNSFFGRIAAQKASEIVNRSKWCVMSDGGFMEEVREVVHSVGENNCFLVHLRRKGCSFYNDSRSYLLPEDLRLKHSRFYSVENNGDLDDYRNKVYAIMNMIKHVQI